MAVQTRKSAEERRDDILQAALVEFAERGLHGASTEEIAKRAGISQPYVFRLFGSKKDLFKATVARCFRQTLELFQRAAEGKRGYENMDKPTTEGGNQIEYEDEDPRVLELYERECARHGVESRMGRT